MRVLHARPDHERDRPDPGRAGRRRPGTNPRRHEREPLPVRGLFRDHGRGARCTDEPRRDQGEARGMKTFDYVRPATIADAVAAAAEPGAAYLASGTNLLDLMKGGITNPNRLVDVT